MNYQENGLLQKCWEIGNIPSGLSGLSGPGEPFNFRRWLQGPPNICLDDFPAFDITDIAKFCYVGKELSGMDVSEAKFCIPPYDICWMEFELTRGIRRSLKQSWGQGAKEVWPSDSDGDGDREGFLISKISVEDWISEETSETPKDAVPLGAKWVLFAHGIFRSNGQVLSGHVARYFLSGDGEVLCKPNDNATRMLDQYWPVLMAMSFLNCPKQIEFIERKSLPRINKDGHKTPQITYKTLVVGPVRRVLDAYMRGDKKLALHLCRGGFRVYTSTRRLFGKHVGRWWWEPQVRGSAKHGEVRKNYKVITTPTS